MLEAEQAHMSQNINIFWQEGIVGYFDAGDFIGFRGVDLDGVVQIKLRYAAGQGGGLADVRADNPDGHVLAVINVQHTGSYDSHQEFTFNVNGTTGRRDIFIVGRNGVGIFNIDKITLVKKSISGGNSGSTGGSGSTGNTSRPYSVADCNDGNSAPAANGATVSAGAGKCFKYRHTGGQLRIGVFSGNVVPKYDVRNCNNQVVSNVNQQLGNFIPVSTSANNCDHYIFVKEASGGFNIQFSSW